VGSTQIAVQESSLIVEPTLQFFILPLPLLVILDFGRFWPFLYQAWLFCAT
jgi:hypothetical protein